MPNIYTRSGDKGTTGLFGGSRVLKNDLRVDAYGTMDEAEANVGYARAITKNDDVAALLLGAQQRMFVAQAQLASDEKGRKKLTDAISQDDIDHLERTMDHYLGVIGKQTAFIRPGADPVSAALHVARTVMRRAERRIVDLQQAEPEAVPPVLLKFVNRLSDFLFVLARYEEYTALRQHIKSVAKKMMNQPGAEEEKEDGTQQLLTLVKRIAAASRLKAHELGVAIVFAAVDAGGNLVYLERESGALLVSTSVAQKKAYTAAALKMPTDALKALCAESGDLYGLDSAEDIIVFGGGLPIFCDGRLIGAVGVSGGTSEEDKAIAQAGLRVLE